MTERQKLRKDPVQAKKLDDAANSFLRFARAQLKRDTLIDPAELKDFLYKKGKDAPTATEVVESMRNQLQKLVNGQLQGGAVQDNSVEVRAALQSLTKRLTNIAKGAQ